MRKNDPEKIFFVEQPQTMCGQKCASLLCLNTGTEGSRILTKCFPHQQIYNLTTRRLREMIEDSFICPVFI